MTPATRDINNACPCLQEKFRQLVDLLENEDHKPVYLTTATVKRLSLDLIPLEVANLDPLHLDATHPHWLLMGRAARALSLQWSPAARSHVSLRRCECAPTHSTRADRVAREMEKP